MTGVDRDEIRAALTVDAVLAAYGAKGYGARQRRLAVCPVSACAGQDDCVVEVDTGRWQCFKCSAHGDIFGLVAAFLGLDDKRDFPKVKEEARRLASLPAPEPRAPVATARPARNFAADWEALARRSAAGEAYLRGRGIDPVPLIARERVRFTDRGEPTVPLVDLDTGEICGLQRRCIHVGADPKVLTSAGGRIKGAALSGRVAALDGEGDDVAVVVEGFADTLAAMLAFPTCVIYGAPGWQQYARVVDSVARRIAEVRGWLLLTVDCDPAGIEAGVAGLEAAEAAGLELVDADAGLNGVRQVRLIDLGQHHDFADAYASGWRHRWPN